MFLKHNPMLSCDHVGSTYTAESDGALLKLYLNSFSGNSAIRHRPKNRLLRRRFKYHPIMNVVKIWTLYLLIPERTLS